MTAPRDLASAQDAILKVFETSGARGLLHAADVDTGHEIGVNSDELVAADGFNIPVLVELCRQYTAGLRAPTERIEVAPDASRTHESTGLASMLDDMELSLRDLSLIMTAFRDKRATDIIAALIGLDAVNSTLRMFDVARTAAAVSGGTNCTTPREAVALLGAVWRNETIGAEAAAEVRRVLAHRGWQHHLASGFPDSRVRVSATAGTPFASDEVGVIEYPTGERISVAVFLQQPNSGRRDPLADGAIGAAGAIAADYLRTSQTREGAR